MTDYYFASLNIIIHAIHDERKWNNNQSLPNWWRFQLSSVIFWNFRQTRKFSFLTETFKIKSFLDFPVILLDLAEPGWPLKGAQYSLVHHHPGVNTGPVPVALWGGVTAHTAPISTGPAAHEEPEQKHLNNIQYKRFRNQNTWSTLVLFPFISYVVGRSCIFDSREIKFYTI